MPYRSYRHAPLILLSVWKLLSSCVSLDNQGIHETKSRQSFLWEAEKGAIKMTLMGTMHIGIREADMDPELWKRLELADTVIIETDISGSDPRVMSRYMGLSPAEDLSALLGNRHWQKLVNRVKSSGSPFSEAQLKRLSPLAIGALLLQMQAKADQNIAMGQVSIDQIIYERGQTLGKKLRTLETNEEQLESLKAVFSVTTIQKVLDEWDEEADSYAQLKDAFKKGDSEALDDLLQEIPKDMRLLLLDKRNQDWIRRLPQLQGQNTLLAVGAAHYPGPLGLLELLKKEGYKVVRLQ